MAITGPAIFAGAVRELSPLAGGARMGHQPYRCRKSAAALFNEEEP